MIMTSLLALVLSSQDPAKPITPAATELTPAETQELERVRMVMNSLRSTLVDPDSAQIKVPSGSRRNWRHGAFGASR